MTMKSRQHRRKAYQVFKRFENNVNTSMKKHDNYYVCNIGTSEKLYTLNATTNATGAGDPLSILLDSGFSGGCVCGDDTFRDAMSLAPKLARKAMELDTEPNFYTFGAGDTLRSIGTIRLRTWIGNIDVNLVPGKLPFLMGRRFMKKKKTIINFAKKNITFENPKEEPNPTEKSRITISGTDHLVPLSHPASGEPAVKKLSSLTVGTFKPTNSEEAREGAPSEGLATLRKSEEQGDQSARCGGVEVLAGARRLTNIDAALSAIHRCKCSNPDDHVQSDSVYADFNVYTALEPDEERQVEDAIIKGWLGAPPRAEAPPQPVPETAALRGRPAASPILPTDRADDLNSRYPSKVWYLTGAFLRRLHLLRHAPAARMSAFVKAAVPLKAKQRMDQDPEVKRFLKAVEAYCEFVVKGCTGCAMHSKVITRPISIALPAAFELGMLDVFTLDYERRLFALMVTDVGLGTGFAFLIRSEDDRVTAVACFTTYIVRWAQYYGVHRKVICDRDSVFNSPAATQLWSDCGIERASTAPNAHFSLGAAERRIGICRYTIDRVRVEAPPTSRESWELILATINNCLANEQDVSGTTPSQRTLGRGTSILRNVMTDSPTSANQVKDDCIEIQEKTREIYQQCKVDKKLRYLMTTKLPQGSGQDLFPPGTKVCFYREVTGAREPTRLGPAKVIAFAERSGQYVLDHNGTMVMADRHHVHLWPELERESLGAQQLAALQPAPVSSAENLEFDLRGVHPADPVEEPAGPDFRPLIHDASAAKRIHDEQMKTISCGRCLNKIWKENGCVGPKVGNQKHKHTKRPGCRLYQPDASSQQGGGAVENQQTWNFNTEEETRKPKTRKEQRKLAKLKANAAQLSNGILTKNDLENMYEEDLEFIVNHLEQVWVENENGDAVESKYMYRWEDLTVTQQREALKKAVDAYDSHNSWDRTTDMSDVEFKAHRAKLQAEGHTVVSLDCTVVKDAKIKNGALQGKVRLAPRGFRDQTLKASWYSTSPTASAISVRLSELLGMRLRLSSWVVDVSDAFFSGEELQDDEFIYIKVPAEFSETGCSVWRRLKREVPGCRGASSAWFRVLSQRLERWGWSQCSTDRALFVRRNERGETVGIMPVHVDDGKIRAEPWVAKELFKRFHEDKEVELSTVEEQKIGESVEFCGVRYTEKEDGEILVQDIYVRNKLSSLDVKRLRYKDADELVGAAEKAEYGTAIGRLIWVLPTQPKHSYEVSFLSRFRAFPRVKHFRRLSAVIEAIKQNPGRVFLPRLPRDAPLKLIAIVDAGAGELADEPLKTRDHACVCVCLAAPKHGATSPPQAEVYAGIVSWQSCGVSRVTHASFDFEAVTAVSSLDLLANMREILGEVTISICPPRGPARDAWRRQLPVAQLFTDSMGLVKAVRLGVTSSLSNRRRRDILDLREALELDDLSAIIHINGTTNPSDVGTKTGSSTKKAMPAAEALVERGSYVPDISDDYQKSFLCLEMLQ